MSRFLATVLAKWGGILLRIRFLRVVLLLTLVSVAVMSSNSCESKPRITSEVSAEIEKVDARTVSPTSSERVKPQVRAQAMSISAEWDVWTSSSESDYFEWVKQQLGGEYSVSSQTGHRLNLTRTLHGDVYTLQLTCTPDERGNDIQIRFIAAPD